MPPYARATNWTARRDPAGLPEPTRYARCRPVCYSARMPSGPALPTGRLTFALERATLDALRRQYDELNVTFFAARLRRPSLLLSRSSRQLGEWNREHRTIEISWKLLTEQSWGVVVEVLKHEMAHQWVHEVLGEISQVAHGPAFRQVCRERGIDFRARGIPRARSAGANQGRIVERVAKLLALAESANEHEARSATLAAQRIMLKYNIEELQRSLPQAYGFRHLGRPKARTTEAERVLGALIGEFFFVEAIWVPVWRPLEGKRGTVLEVCGTTENLDLAEYAHSFLTRTAEQLWRQYKRQHGIRRDTNRRSYLAGVMTGFRDQLAQQKKSQRQQGLVWVGDAKLNGYFRSRHPYIRHTRHTGRHRADVYGHGRDAGSKIVIHRGIRRGPDSGPHLLPKPE
jgi:hypothetical protein